MRPTRNFVTACVQCGGLLLLATVGCGDARSQPTVGPINDLSIDAVAVLRQLPEVATVERSGPNSRPTQRIVHLLDWHFVTRDDYAADLR